MSNAGAGLSRRQVVHGLGLVGAGLALGCGRRRYGSTVHPEIGRLVQLTPFIDTHEHLPDENDRLAGNVLPCDDWGLLLYDNVDLDLMAAGMPIEQCQALYTRELDPQRKWQLLEPFWPAVRNTGFCRAVRVALRELYGIDELSAGVIPRLQRSYEELRRPGFYQEILVDRAKIESCQVNMAGLPYHRSRQPTLLMQDLSIRDLHINPDIEEFSQVAGIEVASLADWHGVIRWWFDTYGDFAVAVKSQGAYARPIRYRRVDAEVAAPVFARQLNGEEISSDERRTVEDHLFWFCVDQATAKGLPVKIHTGYLGQFRSRHFGRIMDHPHDMVDLCRSAPETRFVFMHISYPYWHELIAIAKQFQNAYVDMCWAWVLDPVGATEFLKRYLVAVSAEKIFTFGGDYRVVECVLGHARLARQGIAQALTELVEEGWMGLDEALELVEPLMCGNARQTFRLAEKATRLAQAPWL